MRQVVVVQHESSVPPGSIAEVLETEGVDHVVLEAWRASTWPEPSDVGGLIVLGGTMNVDQLDDYPFLRSSRELMATAMERNVPVMGVCLGAQMMARALGGDVVRAAPRNALFSELDLSPEGRTDPVIEPFVPGTAVLQFHEDTFTIPPGGTPLARSHASGLHQAFRYGETAYAIQFHFEVDAPILKGWCADIGDERLRAEWGTSQDELMSDAGARLDAQWRAGKELLLRFLAAGDLLSRPLNARPVAAEAEGPPEQQRESRPVTDSPSESRRDTRRMRSGRSARDRNC